MGQTEQIVINGITERERNILEVNSWLVRHAATDNVQQYEHSYEILFPHRPTTGSLVGGGSRVVGVSSHQFTSQIDLIESPESLSERIGLVLDSWDNHLKRIDSKSEVQRSVFSYSKIRHALANYASITDLGSVPGHLKAGRKITDDTVQEKALAGIRRLEETSVMLNFIENFFGRPEKIHGNQIQAITIREAKNFLESVGNSAFPNGSNGENTGFSIELSHEGLSDCPLPAELVLDIFDLLSNAKNHGLASKVEINITSIICEEDDSLQILVRDNGKGISSQVELDMLAKQGVSTNSAANSANGDSPVHGNGIFFLAETVRGRLGGAVGVKSPRESFHFEDGRKPGTEFCIQISYKSLYSLAESGEGDLVANEGSDELQAKENLLRKEGFTILKPIPYTASVKLEP